MRDGTVRGESLGGGCVLGVMTTQSKRERSGKETVLAYRSAGTWIRLILRLPRLKVGISGELVGSASQLHSVDLHIRLAVAVEDRPAEDRLLGEGLLRRAWMRARKRYRVSPTALLCMTSAALGGAWRGRRRPSEESKLTPMFRLSEDGLVWAKLCKRPTRLFLEFEGETKELREKEMVKYLVGLGRRGHRS